MQETTPDDLQNANVGQLVKVQRLGKRVAGGTVRVAAACHNGNLCLSVYNDGPSLPTDWQATHTGVGIGNLRTRLQILHGSESELQLRRADGGGAEVVVTLPFREA
jgi:two-component system LytT family sensor kinase